MRAFVYNQFAVRREALVAILTHKGFVTSVRAFVQGQVAPR
jgi:hypothetical protein